MILISIESPALGRTWKKEQRPFPRSTSSTRSPLPLPRPVRVDVLSFSLFGLPLRVPTREGRRPVFRRGGGQRPRADGRLLRRLLGAETKNVLRDVQAERHAADVLREVGTA